MNCGDCCGYDSFGSRSRGFLTKKEKIDLLKEYKDSLDLEAKGVGERINELEEDWAWEFFVFFDFNFIV